jgi:hypothetical protein
VLSRRGILGLGIAALAAEARAGEEPLALAAGPHPLLDQRLIAAADGVTRCIESPAKLPEPVVTGPEDRCFQPYNTVLRDPETRRFRVWYGTPESANQSHLAYMESNDGIRWERPHRVLRDPATIQFGVAILDDGPRHPNPEQRYKYGYYGDGGLSIAVSPDGLEWTPLSPRRVLEHNHDINCIFQDPLRKRYGACVSMYITGETWTGRRRIPYYSYSRDLLNWQPPRPILTPDHRDPGETQFYCVGGLLTRGELLIGMVRVLRDDLPAEPGGDVAGLGYTCLCWTRDGEKWEWERTSFLDRNPRPGSWDRAMTWADCQLPVGDEVYVYYGGYRRGHKVERFTERQLGLARMKRDRYACWTAEAAGGTIRTPLLRLPGGSLAVNAKVDGELRGRLVDPAGKPLAGCDWSDCRPVRGDHLAAKLEWRRPPRDLRMRPVALQVRLERARLYALEAQA